MELLKYRTHYAMQIKPEMQGERVIVAGWVHTKRDLGGKKFIVLRDKSGSIQLIISKHESEKSVIDAFYDISKESVIMVEGIVKKSDKAPRGVEIFPLKITLLNKASPILPLDVSEKVPADMDTRLNARILDLRRPRVQAIFKIRDNVLKIIRTVLREKGFIEVNTPKIIATATEGGAQLFPVLYFGREAFLAQSPQLYKELLASAFERVFEIGPAYRAEESDTPFHLSEFISVDIEAAFIDYEGAMDILEEVVVRVLDGVRRENIEELELIGHEPPKISGKIPRITYDEAIEILQREGFDIKYGEDISTPAQRKLGEIIEGFYFIKDWPTDTRPFYTMPKEDNPNLCEAFDLMYGWLEVASGSTRVHRKGLLIAQLERQGLSPKSFEYFIKWFDYGMPPHAGWGLGLDRFMLILTGCRNIREVVLFPRDKKRLTP